MIMSHATAALYVVMVTLSGYYLGMISINIRPFLTPGYPGKGCWITKIIRIASIWGTVAALSMKEGRSSAGKWIAVFLPEHLHTRKQEKQKVSPCLFIFAARNYYHMRNPKADKNQSDIVRALRKCGYSVQHLHGVGQGCPDLIVANTQRNLLVELKSKGGRTTPAQKKWFQDWPGPALIAYSAEEVIAYMER